MKTYHLLVDLFCLHLQHPLLYHTACVDVNGNYLLTLFQPFKRFLGKRFPHIFIWLERTQVFNVEVTDVSSGSIYNLRFSCNLIQLKYYLLSLTIWVDHYLLKVLEVCTDCDYSHRISLHKLPIKMTKQFL